MGRRKVEMKRIQDKSSRQVTFSKRRGGLIKKARELSVLCDVDLALAVFSARGRLYEFCSGDSLTEIIQRYQRHYEAEGQSSNGAYEAENFSSRYASVQTCSELLHVVERHLDEPNVEELSVTDLGQLERQLGAALLQTRLRKTQLMTESIMVLLEKERMLREENELLMKELAEMNNDGNGDEMMGD